MADPGSTHRSPLLRRPGGWRWYHGLAFYAAVQGTSYGLGLIAKGAVGPSRPKLGESLVGNDANNDYYNRLLQPPFAPPDWAFAPAWTLNNALQIWGLLRALNLPRSRAGRPEFLALQAGFWACFTAFNALYFGLRSPILGAANTNLGLALTLASEYVALARLRDRRVAASLSTVLPWLLLASATATLVALWNRDDLFAAGPFLAPHPRRPSRPRRPALPRTAPPPRTPSETDGG